MSWNRDNDSNILDELFDWLRAQIGPGTQDQISQEFEHLRAVQSSSLTGRAAQMFRAPSEQTSSSGFQHEGRTMRIKAFLGRARLYGGCQECTVAEAHTQASLDKQVVVVSMTTGRDGQHRELHAQFCFVHTMELGAQVAGGLAAILENLTGGDEVAGYIPEDDE